MLITKKILLEFDISNIIKWSIVYLLSITLNKLDMKYYKNINIFYKEHFQKKIIEILFS